MGAKRILILTYEFPPLLGGVGTYCVEIARAAAELGHHVTVVAPDHGEDNHQKDAAFPFAVERMPMRGYSVWSLLAFVKRLMKSDVASYDIVHLADWPLVVAAHLVRLVKPLRARAILHGTDALLFNQARLPRTIRAGRALGGMEKVVANSAYTLSIARREHPAIRDEQCIVALLGVGRDWFMPAGDIADLKTRLGIARDRQVILSVSRLDERKGHRHMLEALSRLTSEEKAGIVYVVVGKAGNLDFARELEERARGIGLPVIFTGALPQDDVRTLYAAASLFLLLGEDRPDKVEGFGLVFLEAAAQGVPSIATPIGGVPEVVLDGKTGLLVEDRNHEAAARAIAALLSDENERSRLGKNARDWANELTWRRCAELTFV